MKRKSGKQFNVSMLSFILFFFQSGRLYTDFLHKDFRYPINYWDVRAQSKIYASLQQVTNHE